MTQATAKQDPQDPQATQAAGPKPAGAERVSKTAGADAGTRRRTARRFGLEPVIQPGATPGQGPDAPLLPYFRSIRLQTLVTLRWLAVAGQTAAIAVAQLFLGVELPLAACAVAVAVSMWLNAVATLAAQPNMRLSDRDAMLTLLFDVVQLSALLFLTGGLTNPFALFLLAPVTIAASVLTLRTTLVIGAFSILAASFLSSNHLPLRLADGGVLDPPALYLAGFWVAIALGVAFQAGYARRVSVEAVNMSVALSATQMALSREQRLSAIGALSAAAAHELGTPLATIKLTASELRNDLQEHPALAPEEAELLAADASLIVEQAARCRRILQRLAAAQSPEDSQIKRAPITAVLAEAAKPHLNRRAKVIFRLNGAVVDGDATGPQPSIPRRPEIIHGIRNLVQNAVDFAASTVWVDVRVDEEITVTIADDGAGFSQEILGQIGEPFATTRGKGGAAPEDQYQGMGLGVFIAKTLLERTEAQVSFKNRADGAGAVVRVRWPASALAGRDPAPRASDLPEADGLDAAAE
ncbi:MAG: ActS/PrrB/RegB family redox-sensitive histidine kinase [Pseudomonadota bacterium]